MVRYFAIADVAIAATPCHATTPPLPATLRCHADAAFTRYARCLLMLLLIYFRHTPPLSLPLMICHAIYDTLASADLLILRCFRQR